MEFIGWFQILLFSAAVLAVTKPLGVYMYDVFEGERQPLPGVFGPIERGLYRLSGVDAKREQAWTRVHPVAARLQRLRRAGDLRHPAPAGRAAVQPAGPAPPSSPDSSFNTAVSFTTNTNWQAYAGEVDDELPHPDGGARLAQLHLGGGRHRRGAGAGARAHPARRRPTAADGIGNFWVDLIRSILYVLLPISIVVGLVLVAQGVIQNLSPYLEVTTLEGAKQTLAMGPVASQEVIKQLGTNGGGFFNANSAHPFENPTPLTNFLEMLLIFAIPGGLTYTFGRMARDQRRAGRSSPRWRCCSSSASASRYCAEADGNPAIAGPGGRRRAPATWRARRSASASPTPPSSPPSPPTRRAARSTRCTTASRRSAAWCRWSTSSSAR